MWWVGRVASYTSSPKGPVPMTLWLQVRGPGLRVVCRAGRVSGAISKQFWEQLASILDRFGIKILIFLGLGASGGASGAPWPPKEAQVIKKHQTGPSRISLRGSTNRPKIDQVWQEGGREQKMWPAGPFPAAAPIFAAFWDRPWEGQCMSKHNKYCIELTWRRWSKSHFWDHFRSPFWSLWVALVACFGHFGNKVGKWGIRRANPKMERKRVMREIRAFRYLGLPAP